MPLPKGMTFVWIFTESETNGHVLQERAFPTLAKARDHLRVRFIARCKAHGVKHNEVVAWNSQENNPPQIWYANGQNFANYRFYPGPYPKLGREWMLRGEIRPIKFIA